ncbi:efflux RND transporter permease subunit [Tumebacillus sp. DT12]|uniref:Efflux RND transporter permease subunit n=1 Tax=Tumebacillus lacus TaxID=2995335 RepID=A0ABT3WZC9_9BACL|nr:efflux RND transporter permease subunit [Tumebacillus lacus]MCX7570020.1 efflux RND transporter permease subunit [Tumebacillus lacus]
MRGIINFSLNNKFALWILTIIVTVAGLYAGINMKQEIMPNLDVPILAVSTVYPGASPEEVAEQISKPLEQRIKNLQGVKTVSSTSMENSSQIVVEYDYDQDMDKAQSDVRDAISGIKLPAGAQEASINRFSLNAFPVVSLSITGENRSLEELTRFVESEVRPSLEGLPGVSDVQVSGQHVKEVQLTYNTEKMAQLGISEDTVKGLIQGSAVKVPLGLFELDQADKIVVVDGNITTLDDLKNLAIPAIPSTGGAGASAPGGMAAPSGKAPAGQAPAAAPTAPVAPAVPVEIPTVKLSEIADLQVVGKAESISRTNGSESIGINIVKGPDANTVSVVNAVKEEASRIEADHAGIKAVTMIDQGKPIEDSIDTMISKALFGALFAIVIILLFLRNIRTTIISIISIPLSLLIALVILKQLDITLNIMTLGAMTVAIGRVVDDSIVVVENIYRRMSLKSEELKGKELIRESTREMFVPILSSTLVTIAVFFPLGLVSGPIGQLFMPFALTMVFALLASLLVAITVVPMLGHSLFKNGLKSSRVHDDKPGALARFYKKVLTWSLNHKLITFGLAVLILIGSFSLVPVIGVSFLPEQEDKYMMVTYTPAAGERSADVEQRALDAEKMLLERAGVANLQYSVGGSTPMSFGPQKGALFYLLYESEFENFEAEKENVLTDLAKLGAKGEWKQQDMGGGGVGGSQLALNVYGDSPEEIKTAVEKVQAVMKDDADFEKIQSSLSKSYEQYTLVANQQQLSKLGLTAGLVAMKLTPPRGRTELTNIEIDGKSYPVYLNVNQEEYKSIGDIENSLLTSPVRGAVPIKDVVTVETGTSPDTITRKDGRMYVEIKADITAKDVAKASSDLQAEIDKLDLPPTINVEFGGVTEQINETFTQLGLAMLAAVAIVYLMLVITFGGGLAPFAILFSLPFTVIGGLVGLLIAGETLSASAMMGALMLIGIVVTNAIVLIDRVIHKEKVGLSTREALLEAAGTRLRPILMTALATIGALLPLALGYESTSGSIISKGLGVTVIGGLASSTLLTLLIVPIVYEFLMKFRKKGRAAE